jgi:hypothetical protein
MSGSPRTWCLACYGEANIEKGYISSEKGYISSLIWEESFGSHQAKGETVEPKPQLVDLPPRVYSMLTALVVMVAALLVLTFLR